MADAGAASVVSGNLQPRPAEEDGQLRVADKANRREKMRKIEN
jgi:hypothetical protein